MGQRMQRQLCGRPVEIRGYDGIIIEGKAHTPVYLWIHDDRVEIRDALPLWGKTTWKRWR